jgi:ribose transport system substrate-binding protein
MEGNKLRNSKIKFTLAMTSVLALVFAAVTSSAVNAAPKALKDIRIAAVVKGLDNPFFIGIKEGIEETALKYGVTANVQAAPGLNDDIGQANKLDSLAGQNYDCYIVIPISSNNLSQAIGKITKRGKTVINIDSPVDAASLKAAKGKIASFAGTDNYAAGKAGGKDMQRSAKARPLVSLQVSQVT